MAGCPAAQIVLKQQVLKNTTHNNNFNTIIKSSKFVGSFRGISRLGSAFIFCDDSDLHVSVFK